MKWPPELTSDKVYAVKTPRPPYPGKAHSQSNDAVLHSNEKHGAIS